MPLTARQTTSLLLIITYLVFSTPFQLNLYLKAALFFDLDNYAYPTACEIVSYNKN